MPSKGVQVQIIEADTDNIIAAVRNVPIMLLRVNSIVGSSSGNVNLENLSQLANYTQDYELNGGCSTYFGKVDDAAWAKCYNDLLTRAPVSIPCFYDTSGLPRYRIKLVATSGYYAISEVYTSPVFEPKFYLYRDNGTLISNSAINLFGGFNNVNTCGVLAFQVVMNGDSITSLGYVNTNGGSAGGYYISLGIFPMPYREPIRQWLNGITSEYPELETDPYANIDGESEITGGGTIGVPDFPDLTATSTGIIGLFAPSPSQMQALADYMWTDFGGTGTDTTEVLKEIVEALKRSISNPLDYVIGLNIIPSQGLSIGESSIIKFGFTSSEVSMPRLSNQYFTVDCGSISFPPLCGNTFLDYAPYSKFSIYLPYIGVKDVDANDFVGHTIGVIYHGDTVTGGVTAYITKDGSVMYQYSGCCALNIPLSADNWGNTISGAVQIATSLVTAGALGGAAGVSTAAAKGAASVASNPSLLSPQVSHSGAVSGGAGCMAVQYPFVIREAVRFHSTAGFNKFSGYPSYYKRSLGEVSGFTTVLDVHLENVPATNGEIAEIENLLKSGVIL